MALPATPAEARARLEAAKQRLAGELRALALLNHRTAALRAAGLDRSPEGLGHVQNLRDAVARTELAQGEVAEAGTDLRRARRQAAAARRAQRGGSDGERADGGAAA